MLFLAIAAALAALILGLLLAAYRRQIRRITEQFRFIREQETNLRFTPQLPFSELNQLADDINALLDENRDTIQAFHRYESQLKETITNLSHDIRTPLTSLDGYFQLLTQSDSPEDLSHYSAIIQNRIQALRDILEQLFTYTKLQDAGYELALEKVDLSYCVYTILFSFYDEFKRKGIEPALQICEEPLYVSGNQEAIQRVLQNTVKNAFEHGADLFRVELAAQNGCAVFRCSNTVEHPEEIDVDKLFVRFYAADSSRRHSSSGLGLYISRELTERMHGTLKARLHNNLFSMELRLNLWREAM